MQRDSRAFGLARGLRKEPSTNANIRDAKGLSLELKAMLKSKDPWDREVEFQRESLRKAYLHILFSPPVSSSHTSTSATPGNPTSSPVNSSSSHASRLQDVLNLLWLDTSHALIHVYRNKVAGMEKAIAEAPNAHRGKGRNGRGGPMPGGAGGARGNNIPGPTARRRLVQSFRTFLKQEEEFFRTLLSRLAVSLYPSDLAGLKSLGVVTPTPEEDDESGVHVTPSAEERKARRSSAVALAHKALICFGDLARYRELYNEPGTGAPSIGAGDGDHKERRAVEKGKSDGDRKLKNWTRAAECYHQARLLLPDNGNPSNQLAVLAQYSGDTLSSTYHYYRALSVRFSFPTARANLEITFNKAVIKWFSEDGAEPAGDDGAKFRAAFVALHGLYFGKTRVPDMSILSTRVEELFRTCVRQRLLPSDIIVKAVVTGLCALWNARMFRSANKSSERTGQSSESSLNFEPYILLHVLSLFKILLIIGTIETTDLVASNVASGLDTTEDLALSISAVLRRTLPAIRILSKWIMGQLEYITRVETRLEAKGKSSSSLPVDDASRVGLLHLQKNVSSFWIAYAQFSNCLRSQFPPDRLPSALEGGVWLEEDVDMLGFAPLRRGTKDGIGSTSTGGPIEIERVGKDVHPNEEQLMRIADMQGDAVLVGASESSPISFVDGVFVSDSAYLDSQSTGGVEARSPPLPPVEELPAEDEPEANYDDDGNYDDVFSEDDDPVDLAMRLATADRMERDGEEDDDDDEEIVFPSLSSSQINNSGNPTTAPRKSSLLQPLPSLQSLQSLQPLQPLPPTASPTQRNANTLLQLLNSPVPAIVPSSTVRTTSPPVSTGSVWASPANGSFPPADGTTRQSFESLPNITHRSLASSSAHQAPPPPSHPLWSPTSAQGAPNAPAFAPQGSTSPVPLGAGSSSLFGNFSPFNQPSRPLPVPTSYISQDPSTLANPFGRDPTPAHSDGWGVLDHHNAPLQQQPIQQQSVQQQQLQQQPPYPNYPPGGFQQPYANYPPTSYQPPPPQFYSNQRAPFG